MTMKLAIVLFSIIFILSSVHALSFSFSAESVVKGDAIHAEGECRNNDLLVVKAASEQRSIFTTSAQCNDGKFSFDYIPGLADPSGTWAITIEDTTDSKSSSISILPSKASGYLIISFLSPSPGSKKRGESISLSIRVTDSGTPVDDANVFFWTQLGEKIILTSRGNGTYETQTEIPLDASLEEWKLTVIAVSRDEQSAGEGILKLPIEKPVIEFTVITPKSEILEAGNNETFELNVKYNESKAFEGKVEAKLNGQQFLFSSTGNGTYQGIISVPESIELNAVDIEFSAVDERGNTGSESMHYIIGGQLNFVLKKLGIYILIGIVILSTIGYWIIHSLSKKSNSKQLASKKQQIEEKIDELNKNYFEKNLLSKAEFNQRMQKLNSELNDVESRLKE